jgi:hypothetical protein
VPPDVVSLLHPRETQVNALELLAVLAAIEQFSASARGSRVLFFLDNTAALGILLRGSSPRAISMLWPRSSSPGVWSCTSRPFGAGSPLP